MIKLYSVLYRKKYESSLSSKCLVTFLHSVYYESSSCFPFESDIGEAVGGLDGAGCGEGAVRA